jgi:hypothetical protein
MLFAIVLIALSAAAPRPEFRAGTARVDITPSKPVWMSGYASRNKPSEGVDTPLLAKALAIEDRKGFRVVIVTTDLLGLTRAITDQVAARAEKAFQLRRAQILFNSSHTHSGPVIRSNVSAMYDLSADETGKLEEYRQKLADDLFQLIGKALDDLEAVSLHFGQGKATFAVNRREFTRKGVVIGVNPQGPTDHVVPVIEARTVAGKGKAVLFGYACHNTTLGGGHYRINGDYAGYAQAELEAKHPGVTALFLLLCGGDQNPNPRGTLDHAQRHGSDLATTVTQVLEGPREFLRSPIKAAFQTIDLAFVPHSREDFEKEAEGNDMFRVRRAKAMLAQYDHGRPVRSTPFPVQAIRFAPGVTVLALGGEVVVDYGLRVKREFDRDRLIVAAYSNDVMCYIPTLRVLREGGYEADFSMVYYGQPGKFTETVEEDLFHAIRAVLRRVGTR